MKRQDPAFHVREPGSTRAELIVAGCRKPFTWWTTSTRMRHREMRQLRRMIGRVVQEATSNR
jgi:hypothetical protein